MLVIRDTGVFRDSRIGRRYLVRLIEPEQMGAKFEFSSFGLLDTQLSLTARHR